MFSTKSYCTRDTDNSSHSYALVSASTSYEYYNNMTWSMWLALGPGTNKNIFSMYDETPNARCWLFSVQDDATFRIIGSWDGVNICLFKTVNPVLDFGWIHVVVTFLNGTFNCYVNNVQQSLSTVIAWGGANTLFSANKQLIIAALDPTSVPLDNSPAGSFTNFSMWNTVLSSAQITELYNNGVPKDLSTHSGYANLTNWFRLDQTDSSTTLTDSRASGVTAAITTSVSGVFKQSNNVPNFSSDPGSANVRSGTAYVINGTNETGTCAVPPAADVLSGIAIDNTTGTLLMPTTSQIAAAVWDEATSGHTTSGTFGKLIQQVLTLAQFLGLK